MNKKGVTILEILISMFIVSIVILLLIHVMISLSKINHDDSYASDDEITRTEIIKNIESDFLKLKLKGIRINKTEELEIVFVYESQEKILKLEKNRLLYDKEAYTLKSSGASYDFCVFEEYQELDPHYFLVRLLIPVLINGENTTNQDDIILTYMGLIDESQSFANVSICS